LLFTLSSLAHQYLSVITATSPTFGVKPIVLGSILTVPLVAMVYTVDSIVGSEHTHDVKHFITREHLLKNDGSFTRNPVQIACLLAPYTSFNFLLALFSLFLLAALVLAVVGLILYHRYTLREFLVLVVPALSRPEDTGDILRGIISLDFTRLAYVLLTSKLCFS
jgi:hypothetical protein